MARLLAVAAALFVAGACYAQSPAYPTHPVRIIVPFAPGGPPNAPCQPPQMP
jgi:tripartite-type tricarboxylate transporter receptor subunit TctC